MLFFFAVLLLLFRLSASVHPAEFVAEPQSVNITQGLTATFNCTAHSIGSYWLVNERLPEHNDNSGRGITTDDRVLESSTNLKEHLLHIPAISLNDNITIQCFIFNQPAIPSTVAKLLIQGRLTSVTNIEHIQLNNTALLVTFTPPVTLLGVPISNYSIEFVDKNTTEWTTGNNTVLPIQQTDYCTEQMKIKVSAWNGVGKGEPSNYTYALHEVPSPTFSQSTALSYAVNRINVLLYSKINNTDCVGKRPTSLTIVIKRNGYNEETIPPCFLYNISNSSCTQVSIDAVSSSIWSVTVNISEYVSSKQHYTVEMVFHNEAGNTSETVRTFSTYQITNATVKHSTGDLICISCNFIPGTVLTGCYAVFIDTQYNDNKTLQVPTTGSNCESTLYNGVYNIYIYEGSSAFGSAPAIIITNKFINTSLIRISTSSSVAVESTSTSYIQTISSSSAVSFSSSQYMSVTRSTTFVNSLAPTVPTNNSQPQGNTNEISSTILLVIAFVVGIVLTLTITSVILLSYCLVKTKKKNKILKLAETAASEKFRHADVLLQTLKGASFNTRSSSLSPHHSTSPPPLPTEPMYDNIEEKRRVHAVNIQALPEIQPCPAYAVPPALPPGLHRSIVGNVQQQYIEFD